MTTINNIEDLIRLLDENPEWLEAVRARILTRDLLELPERVDRLSESLDRLSQVVADFVEATNQRFNATDNALAAIRNDIGILKGGHARTAALSHSYTIARKIGLKRVRNLTDEDLWNMTDTVDISDISSNQIDSFHLADLVIEAADSSGETRYIAVEISYTADDRDIDRAIRNAGFLTRFTGCVAHPVIAGVHQDNRIESQIESGEVFWHQLNSRDLAVE